MFLAVEFTEFTFQLCDFFLSRREKDKGKRAEVDSVLLVLLAYIEIDEGGHRADNIA